MQVFKFSTKCERNGLWSDRKADAEGYFVKKDDNSDSIEGYVKILGQTEFDPITFISGLYSNGQLIFFQMANTQVSSDSNPTCYCFPKKGKGFWSRFYPIGNFFPVIPGSSCSDGKAKLQLEEITDESREQICEKTLDIFKEYSGIENMINNFLLMDTVTLKDYLDPSMTFQMELHCGKW